LSGVDNTESFNRYDRSLGREDLDPNTSYAKVLELAGDVTSVLDVGCNTGYLGQLFIERGATVAGIDNDEVALEKAQAAGLEARFADLDATPIESVFAGRRFDLVVFADVLEHLKYPDRVLTGSHSILTPSGRVVASIPNVAHGNLRLDLLLGRFEYTKLGLLDNTHLRFFTAETIRQLFLDSGFAIEAVERVTSSVDSARIEEAVRTLALPLGADGLLRLLSTESSETFQYVVSAVPHEYREGEGDLSFWTLGDRVRELPYSPAYVSVEAVPNVIADMREAIKFAEGSLAETREYLATVIRDKDEVIEGLEASLAETRAYFENVVQHRERLVAEARSDGERLQSELLQAQQQVDSVRTDFQQLRERYDRLTLPSVTVVVVNWNGARLLTDCLRSLREQDYPAERFRVVVVDNGSTDDSVHLVRREFPTVTLLEAGGNLGFAAGNNVAITATESDYVALLNNDAVAEADWLRRLVEVAEGDPKIAAVNAKILLMHDRLPLTVEVDAAFVPGPHDQRRLSAQVRAVASVDGVATGIEFTRGAFGPEENAHGPFRWITTEAELRIPIAGPKADEVVVTVLPTRHPDGRQPRMRWRIGDELVAEFDVPQQEASDVRIAVTADRVVPLIQNAGSVVLPDGSGRDRGTIVRGTNAFYDTDHRQFDLIEDVPAFCGAAALLRRSALAEVGLFDESFFMYYEDTDLSLRLRRHGWRLVYTPHARVRHHHSATAVEWSPRFCYYTERNRLLMLAKNYPAGHFVHQWARYTARLARPSEPAENRKRMILVQRSLIRQGVAIFFDRFKARRKRPPKSQLIGVREFVSHSHECNGASK